MQIHQSKPKPHNPAILQLTGDPLGEQDAQSLRKKIYELIGNGVINVVLDFQAVKHINSAGLGGLISSKTTLCKAGGDLRIAAINLHVRKVLTITRLSEILEDHPTVELAVASFSRKK
ncbi:MAG TPA: STAS domain-containing protein [Bacteroidota bacterium]|nr:STAS domain-containing protein [Bacteroidota bacterium]